jgi:D-alanyl-D-alanine endopeptidase (penicillin-binding protein 7)
VTAPRVYLIAEPPARLPLLRRDPDDVRPLASLTKLMSALVVLDAAPQWDELVTISAADYRGGARPRLSAGETVSLGGLWEVALVGSDNDALAALVRGLGMTEPEFVQAMNEKAAALGLTSTRFVEPTGLAPGNVSTAREAAVVARAAFARPEVARTLAAVRTAVTVDGAARVVLSSDQHLKTFADAAAGGWQFVTGKTGYLPEGGYNAVVLAAGADGLRVLAVVLGSASLDDRTREVSSLVRWGIGAAAERLAGAAPRER